MSKQRNPKGATQKLYVALKKASEIPVIETAEIHSKGIYWSRDGKREIYIKLSLPIKEKLQVLLHETGHYVHTAHYFNDESRPECEVIANGAAAFICAKYGLNIFDFFDLGKFSDDADAITRLETTIQAVAEHILKGLKNAETGTYE